MSDFCNQCGAPWASHGSACIIQPAIVSNFEVGDSNWPVVIGSTNITFTKIFGVPICPDLLTIDDMGEADNWRGQVVRGFFRVLSWIDR